MSETTTSRSLTGAVAVAALIIGGIIGYTIAPRPSEVEETGRDASGNYIGLARAWAGDLSMRTYPTRRGHFKGTVQYGDPMQIVCSVTGEQITWNELDSDLWYRLANDLYVTSIYTDLLGATPVPPCEEPLPEEPSEDPRESTYAEIRTNTEEYPLHAAPSPDAEVLRFVPNKSALTLLCYEIGDVKDGFYAPSELWYEVEGGGYADDGSLITGGTGTNLVHPCE